MERVNRRSDAAVSRLTPHPRSFRGAGFGLHLDGSDIIVAFNAVDDLGTVYARLDRDTAGELRDQLTELLPKRRRSAEAHTSRKPFGTTPRQGSWLGTSRGSPRGGRRRPKSSAAQKKPQGDNVG